MAIIDKPSDYFNTKLYTGNSSNNRTISGFGFDPDFVWVKCRTSAFSHTLADIVRGTNANLFANETSAEINPTTDIGRGGIGQVTTDGFIAVQGTSSMDNTNTSGQNYVSWGWNAGGTASSNTDGSITSSVSANTTSGFSIVSWTGSGANATIGHSLGAVPKMIIIRRRTGSTTNWIVYHESIGNNNELFLNLTNASTSSTRFQSTSPTSSVFSVSSNSAVNESSQSIIAYCFADTSMSKMGSYTGNGNADGTFVYTGFKPAFIIVKSSSTSQNWRIYDNKRNTFNVVDKKIFPNLSNAEGTASDLDFVSNGFKYRDSSVGINASGTSYIYMAFAENPFVASNFVPTTAR